MAKQKASAKEKPLQANVPQFEDRIENVPLDKTVESPTNPRSWFDEDYINNELAPSIKSVGVIEPIIVRILENGQYEIVVGACRSRASKVAGKTHIPAIIRNYSDEQAFEVQIIENLQRKNPHPQDEAYSFKKMLEVWHVDAKEVAARLGKTENYIAHRLRLNSLIPDIQRMFFQNKLHLGHALELCLLSETDQAEFYRVYLDPSIKGGKDLGTVTAFKKLLEQHFKRDLAKAIFDIADPLLFKDAGSCLSCMHNTGSNALLFPEETRALCQNLSCFKHKTDVHFQRAIDSVQNEKNQYLVSSYSDRSELINELKTAGHTLYQQYNEIDIDFPPDEPKRDHWNYEDLPEEEADKEFQNDYREYLNELKEYQDKLNSGKYPVGLMVSEKGKGQKYLISFRKKGASPGDQQLPENVLIENELKSLREKLVRAKELVDEKVLEFARKEFQSNELYSLKPTDRTEDLSPEERLALVCFMFSNVEYQTRSELIKEFDMYSKSEFEALKQSEGEIAAWITRRALIHQSNISPRTLAGISLMAVARSRMPQVVRHEEQLHAQRQTKAEKTKARIAELDAKLKNKSAIEGLKTVKKSLKKSGSAEAIS